MKLDYDYLRAQKFVPRLHGNGFIQLQLDEENKTRLHVFPNERLVAQKVHTPIHNHIFAYESKILCGILNNVVFSVLHKSDGAYQIYEAESIQNTADTILKPVEGGKVKAVVKFGRTYSAGETYDMPPFEYHVASGLLLTATIMTKTVQLSGYKPRVLCPIGSQPDNDFRRDSADAELLWGWIKRAFNNIKPQNLIYESGI